MIEFDQTSYSQKTDTELQRLLAQFDDLVAEAQECLITELKARGQSDQQIFPRIEAARKRRLPLADIGGPDLAITAQLGAIRRTVHFRGSRFLATGRAFYGTSNIESNSEYGYQEFDTTLWWVAFGIPVVPRGSFRIRSRMPASHILGGSFVVVRRLPFLWAQNAGWVALDAAVLLTVLAALVQGR